MRVVWLDKAEDDYDWQIEYIRARNPSAALEQDERIERQIDALAELPEKGRAGRIKGTRELIIQGTPFVAVYRVRPRLQRIEILLLLHHAQRCPKQRSKT